MPVSSSFLLAALMRLVLPTILGPSMAIHLFALIRRMSSSVSFSRPKSSFGVSFGFRLKSGKLNPLKHLTPLSKGL